MFYPDQQLISIYYLARFPEDPRFKISTRPFDFETLKEESQSFRWAEISELSENDLSFPIDKYVLNMLKSNTKPEY